MIIDSTTLGMESARNYSSVSREAINVSTGLKLNGQTSFAAALNAGTGSTGVTAGYETAESSSANYGHGTAERKTAYSGTGVSDSDKTALETENNGSTSASLDAYLALKSAYTMKISSLSETDLKEKIHQATLTFLLRLIYGKAGAEAIEPEEKVGVVNSASLQRGRMTGHYTEGGNIMAVGLAGGSGVSGFVTQSVNLLHCEYESEQTTFSTVGQVITADGRTIEFNVEARMSREFMQYTETSYTEEVYLIDPLVINLDGNVASVSDRKFEFDLDGDGESEMISAPGAGRGFIALDINGDGMINDGSELFGTKSGDGFADLAQYDYDGNGWIDEADEIFTKLKIWSVDGDGNYSLTDLHAAGIGAIGLDCLKTEFTLKDAAGTTDAVIKSTSMFLFEDGCAGTVQQMDFANH